MDISLTIQHCKNLQLQLVVEFAKLREVADEWGRMRHEFFWNDTPDSVSDAFECRRPLNAHTEDRLIDVEINDGMITFVFEQAFDPAYDPSRLFVPEVFLTADEATKRSLARKSVLDQVAEWAPEWVATAA